MMSPMAMWQIMFHMMFSSIFSPEFNGISPKTPNKTTPKKDQ